MMTTVRWRSISMRFFIWTKFRRRRVHRVFGGSCRAPERMRAGSRGVAPILAMFVLLTFGCHNGAGARTASAGVRVITPIPFGELNDGAEYNASGVVPLGDSRFLFCDNHVADALYELDLA